MAKWFAFLKAVVCFCVFSVTLIWFVHLERYTLQVVYILCVLVFSAFCTYILMNRRKHKFCFTFLTALVLLGLAAVGVCLYAYPSIGAYQVTPAESAFFQGKHIMVLVPHQDDDINLAGGIAELYVHHGSKVSIVYSTNGDASDKSEVRFQEALSVAEQMGIPKEDVYFLGFGDGWQPMEMNGQTYNHIYNSPDEDLQWTSSVGYQETYGTSSKDCEKSYTYTRRNFVDSIQSLILKLQPDVIYAVDYDEHPDHRATSLFFEEAMCNILRSTDYRPKVYKGFCYRTAWLAASDFLDQNNILSTVYPITWEEQGGMLRFYPWDERVRLPVLPSGLHRFLSQTAGFQQLSSYESQDALYQADSVVNGDKVFWERRTDSLLYNAEIQVGDQQTVLLNDFKLMDSSDISTIAMDDGIVPIQEAIRINCSQPENIGVVSLHDDPCAENQILGGYILLPTGEKCEFGELNDNGTATYIPLPEDVGEISSFEIMITEFRGSPGLTEIGAFSSEVQPADKELQYFMFVDEEDNFVYDYYMDTDTQTFALYTYPINCEVQDADFQITMEGSSRCSYTFENGKLQVYCPKFAECQITVRNGDAVSYLTLSHPGALKTMMIDRARYLDYDAIYEIHPFSIRYQLQYYQEMIERLRLRIFSH